MHEKLHPDFSIRCNHEGSGLAHTLYNVPDRENFLDLSMLDRLIADSV